MNQTVDIGQRLREERTRLGLSQPALGEVGGVTKKTQMLYESGERFPDALYLAALAEVGGDVIYILTGKRDSAVPALDVAETVLIESYRRCNAQARQNLIQTAALLSAGLAAGPSSSTGPTTNTASRGGVVSSGSGSVRVNVSDRAPRTQQVRATGAGAQAAGRNIINKGKK